MLLQSPLFFLMRTALPSLPLSSSETVVLLLLLVWCESTMLMTSNSMPLRQVMALAGQSLITLALNDTLTQHCPRTVPTPQKARAMTSNIEKVCFLLEGNGAKSKVVHAFCVGLCPCRKCVPGDHCCGLPKGMVIKTRKGSVSVRVSSLTPATSKVMGVQRLCSCRRAATASFLGN